MIYLILVLAFILRIINLNQSFWLDEAIGVLYANNYTYTKLLTDFVQYDNHPPLYYFLLKFWGDSFGYSEITIRLLSIIISLLTIYLVYRLSKNIFADAKSKILIYLPALLLATSPLHLYYSQEARMYSLSTLLTVAVVCQFVRLLKKSNFFDWFLFGLLILLIGAVDYLPLIIVPVFWLYSLIEKKKVAWYIKLGLCHLLLVIVFIFWYPTFARQSAGGAWLMLTLPAWKDLAGIVNFKQIALIWVKFIIGRISFNNKILYAIFVSLVSLPYTFVFVLSFIKFRRKSILLFLWFFVPLILGILISFKVPALQYFRFLPILPAFYFIITYGLSYLHRPVVRLVLISGMILINFVCIIIYQTDSRYWREDWRSATQFVESKVQSDEIILFEFPDPFAPYQWYSQKKTLAYGALTSVKSVTKETRERTSQLILGKEGIWYFNYLTDLSDPEGTLVQEIKDNGFNPRDIYSFNGVGQITHYLR